MSGGVWGGTDSESSGCSRVGEVHAQKGKDGQQGVVSEGAFAFGFTQREALQSRHDHKSGSGEHRHEAGVVKTCTDGWHVN